MILASHQPNFMPYMGFFYKALHCDVLVISDDVLFSKKGMHNWNRIQTRDGVRKLTVPVIAHHDTRLRDVAVSEPSFNIRKVVRRLAQEYSGAHCHSEGMEILNLMSDLGKEENLMMEELNNTLNLYILKKFGFNGEILYSSSDLGIQGRKDERIFQMCDRTGADVYLSGTGAKVYHNEEEYSRRGIALVYSDYTPLEYKGINGTAEPNMSVIDYIFNQGFRTPERWCL